jgi:hypothetical protein
MDQYEDNQKLLTSPGCALHIYGMVWIGHPHNNLHAPHEKEKKKQIQMSQC